MKTKYQFIALLMCWLPYGAVAQPTADTKANVTGLQQIKPLNLSAMLENNQLLLSGNFESDKLYEVVIYNAWGYKVYSKKFEGTANDQRFSIKENLTSGEYTIAVRLNGTTAHRESLSML